MTELAETVLSPYRTEPSQLDFAGPAVSLPPKAVLSIGMLLHELLTNAAKYGALSVPTGRVSLEWEVHAGDPPTVHMRWYETGVGPVSPPVRTGFGSVMMKASVQHDLKGHLAITYGADGVRYDFDFPLAQPNEDVPREST
jgi:two-component sensor histidine kinase